MSHPTALDVLREVLHERDATLRNLLQPIKEMVDVAECDPTLKADAKEAMKALLEALVL